MTHDESNLPQANVRCDTCLRRRRADESGWREIDLGGGQRTYRCPACEARETAVRH